MFITHCKTILIAIFAVVLFGCGGDADEAKKLGFASVDEMKEAHAKGWHTQQQYYKDNPELAKKTTSAVASGQKPKEEQSGGAVNFAIYVQMSNNVMTWMVAHQVDNQFDDFISNSLQQKYGDKISIAINGPGSFVIAPINTKNSEHAIEYYRKGDGANIEWRCRTKSTAPELESVRKNCSNLVLVPVFEPAPQELRPQSKQECFAACRAPSTVEACVMKYRNSGNLCQQMVNECTKKCAGF
jgi:hypothetical protein